MRKKRKFSKVSPICNTEMIYSYVIKQYSCFILTSCQLSGIPNTNKIPQPLRFLYFSNKYLKITLQILLKLLFLLTLEFNCSFTLSEAVIFTQYRLGLKTLPIAQVSRFLSAGFILCLTMALLSFTKHI